MRVGKMGGGITHPTFLTGCFHLSFLFLIWKRWYRVSGLSTNFDKVLLSSSSDFGSALSNYVLKSNNLYSIPTNKQFLSAVDNIFLFFMFVFYACYAS